jgi:predicted alpha-1,2-mannosidase
MNRPSARRARGALITAATAALALVLAPLAATTPAAAAPALVTDPASYVNTLNGTGEGGASVGSINNFPGPATPFGMVQFSPDTAGNYAGYHHGNNTLKGFSLTHASVGCGAFGDIPMLPTTGAVGSSPWNRTAAIDHSSEDGRPGHYSVSLQDTGVSASLTATTRTGLATFTYPAGAPAQLFVRPGSSLSGNSAATLTTVDDHTVVGSATTGNFCGKGNTYTVYFALAFDQPFTATGTWDESSVSAGSTSVDSSRAGAYFTFPAGSTVKVKASLSYVGTDAARANMQAEVAGFDAAAVEAATRAQWNDVLSKISVAGTNNDDLHTFYTSLYRSLLHPNTFSDVDGRYLGFDSAVHTVSPGHVQYANFSDWDTYRSLAPLQAMILPGIASDLAQSLVNDAEQSGSYPRWALANSATGQMTGDSAVALISSLYAFGAHDFDTATALKYMVTGATEGGAGLNGYVERPGIASYLKAGYAPQTGDFQADHTIAGASITLEWSIDDFAIGRFAAALGEGETAAAFQARGQYWQNLFNPASGYLSPRTASGRFQDGPGYVAPAPGQFGQTGFDEGNAAQYLWLVPQNVAGLVAALGGKEAAAARLDTFMTQLNVGANDPYMWAGNEPNFQTPWLYNYLGQPWKTQEVVDRIRTTLFGNSVNGEPGNDDLGAQSSWYVWAALGLFPTTPGTNLLTVNTPAFDRVVLDLPGGNVTLAAEGASAGSRYIAGLTVDGAAHDKTFLPESVLAGGGDLSFTLAGSRNTSWGTSAEAAPPSFGEGGASVRASATPARLDLQPGTSGAVKVYAQRMAGSEPGYTAVVTAPAGIAVGSIPAGAFDSAGAGSIPVSLTASAQLPDGYYDIDVAVASGGTTSHYALAARVARPNSLMSAMSIVGTASAGSAGGANLDEAGNSYSREQLAAAGLTPGGVGAVGDLSFQWPSSPEGSPDAVKPAAQRIDLARPARTVSFVGAAINGGAQSTATAVLDDGSTVPVSLALGDWVLPSSGGTPVYGNTIVAKMAVRNAHSSVPGAYLYATSPVSAPQGRTITALKLPAADDTSGRLRIFAIASDVVPPTATTTTIAASASTVETGAPLTLTATVEPVSAVGTVRFSDGSTLLGEAPVSAGSAVLPVDPGTVGTRSYMAAFVPADDTLFASSVSAAATVTVTPTTTPPTDAEVHLSVSTVAPGESITVTGANFAAGASTTIVLHSDPVVLATVTAGPDGSITASATIPVTTPAGAHTIVVSDGNETVSVPLTVTAGDSGSGSGSGSGAGPRIGSTSAAGALADTGLALSPWLVLGALGTIAAGIGVRALRRRSVMDRGGE